MAQSSDAWVRSMLTRRGELLARGATADVYAYGDDAVVKVLQPGIPSEWAVIEAANTEAVHAAGLPAVEVLEQGHVDERPAIVFRRIVGPSMAELMVTNPSKIEPLAQQMAEIQLAIHRVDPPEGIPFLKPTVLAKIEAADLVSESDRVEASSLLGVLDSGRSLCHGDLHPGNILMGKDGPVLIDWFDAVVGCPVADIVRSSLLLRTADFVQGELAHFRGAPVETVRRAHDVYLSRALQLGRQIPGPSRAVLGQWEAVLAVSRLAERVPSAALIQIWESRLSDSQTSPLLAIFDQPMVGFTHA